MSIPDKPYPFISSIFITVIFIPCLFIAGCDEIFDPLQENDSYYFSINGYLDATADTQWVRVMPVREELLTEPGPIDATVTLEHPESGKSVVMNDSLFSFSQGVYAWNFWTTMDLDPEQTYRITAKRSDGKSSYAEVDLPEDFPTPLLRIQRNRSGVPLTATIFIDRSVENLADVQTLYRTPEDPAFFTIPHLEESFRNGSGGIQVLMDLDEDYLQLNAYYTLPAGVGRPNYIDTAALEQQIFIVSAGSGYPNFPNLDEKIVALPEGVSNIENGVGYLAGFVTKTIPYQSCLREDTADLVPCETEKPPW
ncbi:MAG: hypothetical protein WD035_09270 [Balneolaceae bacterium]